MVEIQGEEVERKNMQTLQYYTPAQELIIFGSKV